MITRFRFALFLLCTCTLPAVAQRAIEMRGSFLLSFDEDYGVDKKAWPFFCTADLVKTSLVIKDDSNKKGVTKRIIYNRPDSTWLMLLSYNNVKQATRIHSKAMFSSQMKIPFVDTKQTSDRKVIEGYPCRKYILISENDSAVVWATDELRFDVCELYRMLSHCGMMSSYVDDGTWFYSKKIKGMVLEATSFKRKTGAFYRMRISEIKPGAIDYSSFDLTGYRISDIPEGQNCGAAGKKMGGEQ